MKALPISVFTDRKIGTCANGGVSESFDELLLVCEEGFINIDEDNPPENLVVLVKRELFGGPCHYIRPYKDCPSNEVGYMFGGSFAHTSDSRFSRMVGIYGAVPIHDRTETQKQYDMYSR